MAEQIIKEIDDRIQNKKKLSPALPQEDVPIVNIRNVKMLSPPNYKMGEKVPWCFPTKMLLCSKMLLVQFLIHVKEQLFFFLWRTCWEYSKDAKI